MLDKLEAIYQRWEDIQQQLSDPDVVSDMKRYTRLSKDYKDLGEIVKIYKIYKDVVGNIEYNDFAMRNDEDPEIRDMAKMELEELVEQRVELEEDIKQLLIPKDPEDEKNVILEVRAGTGGDEAAIFAGDLFRMYTRFSEAKGWLVELMSANEAASGGYKEIVARISGDEVYGDLKYESGVHRVQRVPVTESQGRVHTSAASVAVLPEVDDEVIIDINPADLRVDTYRASGAGGQHVNKTESAVRITHVPTGVVAECQKERSQFRNREVAMTMLKTRLYEIEHKKQIEEIAKKRKTLVSTGDRSAKIRTYNYPQNRVTDHRISLSLNKLTTIVGGDIQEIIDQLKLAENAEKMKAGEEII